MKSGIEKKRAFEIDWKAQWEIHGHNFYDGYVHIDLKNAISSSWNQLKLMPGAGFGDFSHPTTRLMIKLMEPQVKDQYVVDIGCGSGILALCAAALGAKQVYAIDIDESALEHAKENALLNQMKNITFHKPDNFLLPSLLKAPVILMNMIMSEQQQAWHSLPSLHKHHGMVISSGILFEQKLSYLDCVTPWGWSFVDESEEQGWLGLKFSGATHPSGATRP